MAEDKDSKTEAPTPRRRQEARSSGQVAKSNDLAAGILLLSALIILRFVGPGIWYRMLSIYRRALSAEGASDQDQLIPLATAAAMELFKMVAPFMALMALAALMVVYAQVGMLWTLKPITPSLKKLNPITGFGRLLSPHSLVLLLINLGKLGLVVAVVYPMFKSMAEEIVFSLALDHLAIFGLAAHLTFRLGITLAILLTILALVDYFYQRYKHEKDLKMTKAEVKDELRAMEGDPVVKRRRREVQMQLAMQRLGKTVPEANVVVTNPTHVAVALRYDSETMTAPKVIAKGADQVAIRIRQLAAAAGVPILERPPLARALHASVEIGQEVPERFYQAVAEILAYVYELSGKRLGPQPVPAA